MHKQSITTLKIRLSLLLGVAATSASPLQAESLCMRYDPQGSVVAELERMAPQDASSAMALTTLEQFLAVARSGDSQKITRLYSKLDASQRDIEQRLKEYPDKFADFGSMSAEITAQRYQWGDYALFMTRFTQAGNSLTLAEPLLCTSLCQVSNFFERPNEPEDLLSRYLLLSQNSARRQVPCPSAEVTASVSPTVDFKGLHPLKFHFAESLFTTDVAARLRAPNERAQQCWASIQGINFHGRTLEEIQADVQGVIDQCSVNTDVDALIPVTLLDQSWTKNWYSVDAFVALLGQTQTVEGLLQLETEQHTLYVVRLKRIAPDPDAIVLLPLKHAGEERLFDWDLYGSAVGELLSSAIIHRFIDNTQPGKGQP